MSEEIKEEEIKEIDNKLEKIAEKQNKLFEEQEKLFEEQEKLEKEKRVLISKKVINNKILNKTKWKLDAFTLKAFTLKATSKEELYDLQITLNLGYHGDFEISENIRFVGDDGDFLIHANSLAAGIEFIKLAGLELDTTDTDKEIMSLRKKADSMQEFIESVKTIGFINSVINHIRRMEKAE